ncbi:MAG: carboxypeptidase-like regulatory domain-containing protein, partial [Saprospiraceae bacterium]|nr:carboxypeptidase-like regulatory domain-containing protein [Saprospiraceae bacterium]
MANQSSTSQRLLFICLGIFCLFMPPLYAQDIYDVYVYDGGSEPVTNAEIDLTPCGLGVQRTKSDGKLHFSLPTGTNCYMTVKKFDLQTVVSAVSPTGPRKISVGLVPDRSGSFVGMVYDEATGAPLPRSTVYARSNTGTHWNKTTTDQNGRYVLKLNGRQEYAVTFAHEGFSDVRTLVRTERDVANAPQLSPVSLSPGSSMLLTWLANNPSGIPKVAPIGTLPPGSANGYTVQLASGPTNFADVASKYADLTKYGQLY